jgi:hypothetical protein
MYSEMPNNLMNINDERIRPGFGGFGHGFGGFGHGFGRPFGFGFGRPFGFGAPFFGGFLGGLATGALLSPYGYGYGYGYPYYGYPYMYPWY